MLSALGGAFICALAALSTALAEDVANGAHRAAESRSSVARTLDMTQASLTRRVAELQGDSAQAKFVEVEVGDVVNPTKAALSFEVYYESAAQKTLLGSFSLFPPDNPGVFIVPTQGKVKRDGAITVQMVSPDQVEPSASPRASIKRIALRVR